MARERKHVKITVLKNGPLRVSGDFEYSDPKGADINRDHDIFFCRCGGSKNKPYCDGSHRRVGVKN